ncbi:MAG TPA: hypothetical protein PKA79_02355 [Oligoflexia bacterium]|nr:hypothetical protein [Oligoflexia bacterium]
MNNILQVERSRQQAGNNLQIFSIIYVWIEERYMLLDKQDTSSS